jgi:preprotein translocase subunit SecD
MAPDGSPNPAPPAEPAQPVRPATCVPVVPVERRPWLRLVAAAVAVLVAAAAVGTVVWWRARPRADLVMTLSAGTAPPAADLRRAADLLLDRLSAAGYGHPRVTVSGDRAVVVTVAAGGDADGLRQLARPGRLSFRAVVAGPTTPHTRPATAPSEAAVPAALVAKLGPAYPAGRALADPAEVGPDALASLAPFGVLTPDEVAALPPAMQYAVPTITCAQLNSRTPGDDPAGAMVACERTGTQTKYLLDPAAVTADDVAGADVELQAVPGWTVTIRFTAAGQPRWTALTRAAVGNTPSNEIAIVVDHEVISAPTVQAVITGDATISGTAIDREAARRLAALLRYGPLPVMFTVAPVTGGR